MANDKWAEFIGDRIRLFKLQNRTDEDADFADYLGISPSLLSHWKSGRRTPSSDVLDALAEKLGTGVYAAAEKPRRLPNIPRFNRIYDNLALLPEDLQEAFANWVEEEADKAQKGERMEDDTASRPNFQMAPA